MSGDQNISEEQPAICNEQLTTENKKLSEQLHNCQATINAINAKYKKLIEDIKNLIALINSLSAYTA